MSGIVEERTGNRERIIDVAAALLREQGQAAVTTRGVAERAGVQAPTIYRLFGDKDGLLDAVAEHVMTTFTAAKASTLASATAERVDALDDLRQGWNATIDFGIANPDLYVLFSDPTRMQRSSATQAGIRLLAGRVHRVAEAGRLRVGEDRAVELIHAAGTGAVLATLARAEADRNRDLADTMFEAVLAQILTPVATEPDTGADSEAGVDAAAAGFVAHAVALRAHVDVARPLTPGERVLLGEWLDRIIAGAR